MPHRNFVGELAQSALELQQATRIGCGHRRGASLGDVPDFPFLKFGSHLRLRNSVYTRAASAPHRLRKFDQLKIGNRLQDFSRLPGYFLAVAEMASLVVSDRPWCRPRFPHPRLSKLNLAKPLVNIANFRGPFACP